MSQLTVAEDAAIFLQTGDEPELLLAENALHTYAGEFIVGKQYDKSMKEGGNLPPHSISIPPPLIPSLFDNLGKRSRSLIHALCNLGKQTFAGVQMFQWMMEDDQYIASFRCDPP